MGAAQDKGPSQNRVSVSLDVYPCILFMGEGMDLDLCLYHCDVFSDPCI